MIPIKVCQFVAGDYNKPNNWFSKYVEPVNRMYCETHGYEYAVDRISEEDLSPKDRERGLHWLKVPLMRKHLKDCTFLLYLDADCVFYNHLFRVEEELVPLLERNNPVQRDKPYTDTTMPHFSMLVAADMLSESIRGESLFNSGVCLVHNNAVAHRILERWNNATDIPGLEFTKHEHPNDQMGFMYGAYPYNRSDVRVLKDYYLLQGRWGYFIRHVCLYITKPERRDHEFENLFHSPMMQRNRELSRNRGLAYAFA